MNYKKPLYLFVLFLLSLADYQYQLLLSPNDLAVSQWFYSLRQEIGESGVWFFTLVTNFGDWLPVVVLIAAVIALLIATKRYVYIAGLLVCMIGNQVVNMLLKIFFARPRLDMSLYAETSFSFPSGHSAGAMAFYGFVAYILLRERIKPKLSLATGLTIIALIGLSRLYLNAHYLADVVAGYIEGGLWIVIGAMLVSYLDPVRNNASSTVDELSNYDQPNQRQETLSSTQKLMVKIILVATLIAMAWIIPNESHPLNPERPAVVASNNKVPL